MYYKPATYKYDMPYRPRGQVYYNLIQYVWFILINISHNMDNLTQPTNLPPITATDFSESLVSDKSYLFTLYL